MLKNKLKKIIYAVKTKTNERKLEDKFESLLKQSKIPYVTQYKFHKTRKWLFDFAILENKIAIEVQGGLFMNGRHTRGIGYCKDAEKFNMGIIEGWRIFKACGGKQNFSNLDIVFNQVKELWQSEQNGKGKKMQKIV